MTTQVNMHEAKSQLSALADKALHGERVIIARAGKPCLELKPLTSTPERQPGRLRGQIQMTDDFEQTPPEVIAAFEGGL